MRPAVYGAYHHITALGKPLGPQLLQPGEGLGQLGPGHAVLGLSRLVHHLEALLALPQGEHPAGVEAAAHRLRHPAQYPTPFHIYDERGIRENARALKAAFAWNPGFKEYFAVKAHRLRHPAQGVPQELHVGQIVQVDIGPQPVVARETGCRVAFINLSGGVGVPYRPDQPANDIAVIGEGVRKAFEEIALVRA